MVRNSEIFGKNPHIFALLLQIDLKAEREFETNLAFILDFTSPEITANKVRQGAK